jgi:DNA-binding MarR family transcriptional regulator
MGGSAALADWRHDNTGRLLFDSTRKFQERVLAQVNRRGYPAMRIAHLAVTRHVDLAGTRIADLAQRAGVTKQSMGEMVDQLLAMGLITREPDALDRRAKIVAFTPEGRRLLTVIRKAVLACEEDVRARIGTRAHAALRAALTAYCRTATETEAASAPPQRRRA